MTASPRNRLAFPFVVLLLPLLAGAGCLKTRAQLKDEGAEKDAAPAGQPAQIQEVEPKGGYVIDELKSEITRLTGRIEDIERGHAQNQTQANAAQKEEIKKLESRIQELETAQAQLIEELKKAKAAPPADPQALLDKGKAQVEGGQLDAAVESFTAYLKSPGIRSAEEATFLRAEALYELKQYKRAISDYAQFPEKYSKSKHMPTALFKIGQSFLALNSKEDARAFFQELVEKFPKSPEAKKARTKLK